MRRYAISLIGTLLLASLSVNAQRPQAHAPRPSLMEDMGDFTCQACEVTLFGLKKVSENKMVVDLIKQFFAERLCPMVAKNSTVCAGGADILGGALLDAVSQALLDPEYFCENTLPMCHSGRYRFSHAESYINQILSTKPKQLAANDYLNNIYEGIHGMKRKTITAVHITDPHIDYQYTVGSDANCTGYLCCRAADGFPSDPASKAGEWGAYLCDLPPKTLASMFDYIRDVIKPDVVFWTGDNSPHSIWDNTPEEVVDSTRNVTEMMTEAFANTGIAVYPIEGNHDVWPSNTQDFSKPRDSQFVLEYSKIWQNAGWLNADDAVVFEKFGYYSKWLELSGGRKYPKTKIIAMNTNSCYYMNFAILKTRYDPGEQLAWLQAELEALEAIEGQAIFIGHIPPVYYECIHGFSGRFKALAERFQHVIRFGLYGHEHDEWMQIYTAVHNPSQRLGMSFMSGSATSFTRKNPSFTVIDIDEQFMVPLNLKTYFFNISKAAKEPQNAQWELLHDYIQHYNLTDMSPDSLYTDLALRVRDDEEFAKNYLWNKVKKSAVKQPKGCHEGFRRRLFCEISQPEQFDFNTCMGQPLYDFINEPQEAIFNLFTAEWVKST